MKKLFLIFATLFGILQPVYAAGLFLIAQKPYDPSWYKSYQIGGVNPSFVMDFAGGRYFDGTNANADPATMVSSPASVSGSTWLNGYILNNLLDTATGNVLAALQAKPALICVEVSGGTAAVNAGIVSFGLDSPIFQVSTNKARTYKSTGSPTGLDTTNVATWTGINRVASAVVSTGRNIALNAVTRVSDANIYAVPSAVQLGSYNGGSLFGGSLRALYVISSGVTIAGSNSCSSPPAWAGTNALNFTSTNFVDFGNVLQYEYTQPWSFGAAILGLSTLGATANVIATNVTTSTAFPGIDFAFIDPSGHLHVRLINNIVTPHYIGVSGSTVLNDNKPHYLFATYDGSGTAAGVKLYVDGVAEILTIESDTLAGLSIVAVGQDLYVGNQKNHTDFPANCVVDSIRMSNIVRSAAYIASHSTPATVAPVDSNTVLALDFEEGTGITTADSSASGFTGTISVGTIWDRQN